MRLSNVFAVLIIGMGVTIGMMTFVMDLSASHGLTGVPEELQTTAENTMDSMNETANTMMATFTGETSWVQTAYNIFFVLPVSSISTFADTAAFGLNFGSAAVTSIDATGGVVIPGWIFATVILLLISTIAFGIWATIRMG